MNITIFTFRDFQRIVLRDGKIVCKRHCRKIFVTF